MRLNVERYWNDLYRTSVSWIGFSAWENPIASGYHHLPPNHCNCCESVANSSHFHHPWDWAPASHDFGAFMYPCSARDAVLLLHPCSNVLELRNWLLADWPAQTSPFLPSASFTLIIRGIYLGPENLNQLDYRKCSFLNVLI